MRIEGSIYNYLSTSLIPKKRNQTHKSSELKEVYNSMARYNKNSPLYLLSLSENKQSYIINIKEAAHTLQDVAYSFSDTASDIYSKKTLVSGNNSSISGTIKSEDYGDLPDTMDFNLSSLASEQINIGKYISSNSKSFSDSTHNFTIHTLNSDANFSISVSHDDSNLDIQNKLSDYINNRNIGVKASVLKEGNNSALMLSSTDTGSPDSADGLYFSVDAADTDFNLVKYLGLDNVNTSPSNAVFSINGEQHESSTNHISINQAIELDFHEPSDTPVKISLVPDTTVAMEQINSFIDAYNSLVDLASKEDATKPGTRNLLSDISGIVAKHKSELDYAGLMVDESNHIVKDDKRLSESLYSGDFSDLFNDLSSFREDIGKTTSRLTLDPMAYINKLIVTYPNPADKIKSSTPYTKSIYSGLIYNNYA